MSAGEANVARDESAAWMRRIARVWALAFGVLTLLVAADVLFLPLDMIDRITVFEDGPFLLLAAALVGGLLVAARTGWITRLPAMPQRALRGQRVLMLALVLAAGLYAATAVYLPVTMDEVMARFDAEIFSHGDLVARVAPEWREYLPALQWQFRMNAPGNSYWASTYLPGNAAVRGLFARLGDQDLASPFWAGVSVVALWALARRLWPDRADAAWLAPALLLTSSQFLVTGITAFAMTAHLALNLVWLWLFLRRGPVSHAAAIGAAAVATGLHQLIFHPLFAAPFVLTLWLQRRWAAAAIHTAAYAAIGLFWVSYWSLVIPGDPTDLGRDLGPGGFVELVLSLLRNFELTNTTWLLENLLRFGLWQSLLVVPLALLALPDVRRNPTVRSLALGLALTTAAVWILLPNQGFGWGYRYLHGLMGGLCLLAVYGWVRVTDGLSASTLRRVSAVLVLSIVLSAIGLVPLRFTQAYAYTQPFARAARHVYASRADVVVIDERGVFKAHILPANDPYLRRAPKVMMLGQLQPSQLERLCRTRSVEIFDQVEGRAAGLRLFNGKPAPAETAKRALMRRLGCDARRPFDGD